MIENKNIIVTGASSGIGKSIMDELVAQEGNRILAACRHAEAIQGYGDNVIPFSCDLSTQAGVDALFAKAEELFDKVDVFFCNAGAPYYERFDYEDWNRIQRIFDLNTVGHIYTYSKYLHHLNGREGRLVYTISAMGEMALPGYALYAATKFAMKGFQQAIRDETPENLKISCVYPVSTKTNFFKVGGGGIKMESPFPVQAPEKVGKAVVKGHRQAQGAHLSLPGLPAEQDPDERRPARQEALHQGPAGQAAPLRQARRGGKGRHPGRHQAQEDFEIRRKAIHGKHP